MCSSRWTRYDWAINEASRANDMNEIKVRSYGKRRKKRTRMGDYRPACPVGSRSVGGLA